jgi:hypothetical protein
MEDIIYLGRDRQLQKVSQAVWKQHLAQILEHGPSKLSFMTEAHHLVRNFVVVELTKRGQPIEPELISEMLKLGLDQVDTILDELEQKLFFLVRNAQGAVSWAYPVTVETTPHRLTFKSGEQLYAA